VRRDVLELAKKAEIAEDIEKKVKDEVQKLTDKYIKLVDEALTMKEKEIMEI
jgi:ribosome recycling factor